MPCQCASTDWCTRMNGGGGGKRQKGGYAGGGLMDRRARPNKLLRLPQHHHTQPSAGEHPVSSQDLSLPTRASSLPGPPHSDLRLRCSTGMTLLDPKPIPPHCVPCPCLYLHCASLQICRCRCRWFSSIAISLYLFSLPLLHFCCPQAWLMEVMVCSD